jgi:hypothetical protein
VVLNKLWDGESSHGIDCEFYGTDPTEHISITNNWIKDQGYDGIKAEHSNNITISNNTITQENVMTGANKGRGITLAQDGLAEAVFLHDISVTGNTINGGYQGIYLANLDADNENISIANNTINTPDNTGIALSAISVPISVCQNTIRDAGGYLVDFSNCSFATVSGNTMVGAAALIGVHMATTSIHNNISDNIIYSYGYQVFQVQDGCDHNIFANNQVYGGTRGIDITTCDGLQIIGNNFYGGSQQCIRLAGCKHCIVTGNRVDAYGQSAIAVFDSGANYSLYNLIANNDLSDSQGGATQDGINEYGNSDYNTYRNNNILGNVNNSTFVGAHNTYDQMPVLSVSLDLSGGASDLDTFFSTKSCYLAGYTILYTEASSADAGVNIRIGRYQNGVALDDDYFDIVVSEVSQNKGYTKHYASSVLTQMVIAAGDVITVGTAGGKVGTGEIRVILQICENGD